MKRNKVTPLIWRLMRWFNPRAVAIFRRGLGPAGMVLTLTSKGRKSGLPLLTPLQYEHIQGAYYVGSARGAQADWFRNLQADPHVQVEIRGQRFDGLAEAITEPEQVADFLEYRLKRHPLMIGLLTRMEGLPWRYSRSDLERFASGKAAVAIRVDQK